MNFFHVVFYFYLTAFCTHPVLFISSSDYNKESAIQLKNPTLDTGVSTTGKLSSDTPSILYQFSYNPQYQQSFSGTTGLSFDSFLHITIQDAIEGLKAQVFRIEDGDIIKDTKLSLSFYSSTVDEKTTQRCLTIKPKFCELPSCDFLLQISTNNRDNTTISTFDLNIRKGIILEKNRHFIAKSCGGCGQALYAAAPSFSDFDLGLIIQPDFIWIGEPGTFIILQWYEAPPWIYKRYSTASVATMSLTYETPRRFTDGEYLFFDVDVDNTMNYRIFIQANIIEYGNLFLNGYGWILLVLVIMIMVCTLYKSFRLGRFSCGNISIVVSFGDNLPVQRQIRGATIQELSELVITTYGELREHSASSSSECMEECCICTESYQPNDAIRALPCEHIFHKICIDKWFQTNSSCPICRSSISTSDRGERCCLGIL